jgi:hypothetical protein
LLSVSGPAGPALPLGTASSQTKKRPGTAVGADTHRAMSEVSSGPSDAVEPVDVHHYPSGEDHGGHKRLRADHPPDEPQPAVVGSVSASPEASLDSGASVDGVGGAGTRAVPDARGGGSSLKAKHKKRPGATMDVGTLSGPELLPGFSSAADGQKRLRSDSPLSEPVPTTVSPQRLSPSHSMGVVEPGNALTPSAPQKARLADSVGTSCVA